ncbi:hypothetical protein [Thiolapillus sp.]
MNSWVVTLLLFVLALPANVSAESPEQKGYQAVKELGRLNGIALNCRYFDQAKRIKQMLITSLPKRRELGQLFEDETDASFKSFIQSGAACPSPAAFGAEVDKAGAALARIF